MWGTHTCSYKPGLIDFGVRHRATVANLLRQEADQVLVVDILLAVGEGDEAIVGLLQLFTRQRVAELLETIAQRGAPRVLAQDELRAGRAHRRRSHDLVAERVG